MGKKKTGHEKMEINILTEILFGFSIALTCGFVAFGFSMILRTFRMVGDLG